VAWTAAPWPVGRTDRVPAPEPELAAAKVNLYLHVLGRRADGYHDLQSLVAFADCGDSVAVTGRAREWSLTVDGSFAEDLGELATDDNLVLRAACRLAGTIPNTTPVALRLTKTLPVAAGIGGGSADAAAVIRLLAEMWGGDAGKPGDWADLGADIPVCLVNKPALVEGMGERVTPVPGLPDLPAVLANPGIESSTGAVFAALDGRYGEPLAVPVPRAGLDVAGVAQWLNQARNDLTRPAMSALPPIGETLAALAATPDVLLARMSGSGATCFGLYPTQAKADAAATWLRARAPGWWIKQTTLVSGADR